MSAETIATPKKKSVITTAMENVRNKQAATDENETTQTTINPSFIAGVVTGVTLTVGAAALAFKFAKKAVAKDETASEENVISED